MQLIWYPKAAALFLMAYPGLLLAYLFLFDRVTLPAENAALAMISLNNQLLHLIEAQ